MQEVTLLMYLFLLKIVSLLHFISSMQTDPILDTTGLDYHLVMSAMYLSL